MRDLHRRSRRSPRTTATVLLRGESGIGKELVARAIHDAQPAPPRRRSFASTAPRCPSRCSRASSSATSKGAFTGAVAAQAGPLELAERRHALPRRDWRAVRLDCRRSSCACSRSGELRARRRDRDHHASTCASSPRPTAISRRWSRAGEFREDLFYRLNVVPLRFRRCASDATTSPLSPAHFSRPARRRQRASVDVDRAERNGAPSGPPVARQRSRAREHGRTARRPRRRARHPRGRRRPRARARRSRVSCLPPPRRTRRTILHSKRAGRTPSATRSYRPSPAQTAIAPSPRACSA